MLLLRARAEGSIGVSQGYCWKGVSVIAELAFMQLAWLKGASKLQRACRGCGKYSRQQGTLLGLDICLGAAFFRMQNATCGWQLRGGL